MPATIEDIETEDYAESITFDAENLDEPKELKDLPPQPKCKTCRVCGFKHFGRCFDCPHNGDVAKFGKYENSPCADCGGPSNHLKNGHGKVLLLDEAAHGDKYQAPKPIESDANYVMILDVLRAIATLRPDELHTFLLIHYYSETYVKAGKEMESIFKGSYKKNRIMKLLKSSTDKLQSLISAEKIINGKLSGQ